MKISVVIPLYNEIKHISQVVKGVKRFGLQVIVVDDGSSDSSHELAKRLNVILLTHEVNLGKGGAMKTGADYAFTEGRDAVIFMDSDGQHSPKNLTVFLDKIKINNYDVVLGSRNLIHGAPFIRRLGNKIASIVIGVFFGIKVSDPLCGFRAITQKAYKKIKWESTGYGVESEMLAKMGKFKLKFTEVPVDTIYHDRDKGVSVLDAFGVLLDVLKWRLTP